MDKLDKLTTFSPARAVLKTDFFEKGQWISLPKYTIVYVLGRTSMYTETSGSIDVSFVTTDYKVPFSKSSKSGYIPTHLLDFNLDPYQYDPQFIPFMPAILNVRQSNKIIDKGEPIEKWWKRPRNNKKEESITLPPIDEKNNKDKKKRRNNNKEGTSKNNNKEGTSKKNKKGGSKKVSPKKVSPKKVSPKKVSRKKVSRKKVSRKKVSLKKVSRKKVSRKKVSLKKVSRKKGGSKKVSRKKVSRKRVSRKRVSRKKVSLCRKNKIGRVMKEFKSGKLKMKSGNVVTNRKQAIAIALSESDKYC